MNTPPGRHIMFSCIVSSLIILLAACASTPPAAQQTPAARVPSTQAATAGVIPTTGKNATPVATTRPVPPVQTGCPAAGTGRPAVLAPLALGHDPALLYTAETQGSSTPLPVTTLFRYDATTGVKTVLLKFSQEFFLEPQISADGQWLLFVTTVSANAPAKLQLIRMDGQGLQTLYCGSIGSVQWSMDQRLVSFYSADKGNGLYLLNLQSGSVQRVLDLESPLPFYALVTWLDATRLYLDNPGVDAPANSIFILDISKGPDQKPGDLIPVFQAPNPNSSPYAFINFDSGLDGKALFVSLYSRLKGSSGTPGAPSSIKLLPAAGGKAHTLYTSSTLAIPAIRVIDGNSLCLLVENFDGKTGQNGLWKMNVDGTGLTRLTTFSNGINTLFNGIAQFPWSNFSRDSSLYAIWAATLQGFTTTDALLVGSLQGGTPTTIESAEAGGTQFAIVGWTTE